MMAGAQLEVLTVADHSSDHSCQPCSGIIGNTIGFPVDQSRREGFLQSLFGQVRTFAFVSELAEVTDLFADHPVEQALGLIFGGDVLDVDANSDYGAAFGRFHEDFGSAVNRRSTVIILGDGRGNGNDPNVEAFAEITRRARETIWLTPEPRYSWGLGGCDLPVYAEYCSRVRVVRDLTGLESAAEEMATELVGR